MKSKKKILFVLHVPPPVHGSSVMGGVIKESVVVNETFDSKFINLGTSQTIDEIGKNGLSKIGTYIKIVWSVFRYILTFKPNVVYLAMTAKGMGFYKDAFIVLMIKLLGKSLVIHFHNKGVKNMQDKVVDNLLYKLVFRKTKVILLSQYLYHDIEKYVEGNDVYYCPNGIIDNSQQSINRISNSRGQIRLIFLSNLLEFKGVYVLLDALEILKRKNVKFMCNFVGGEGDITAEDFNSILEKKQLKDCVKYLGKKYGEEKNNVFMSSDIFVHPTNNDCFPLVLLEASHFSLPLVSTKVGAIPEIIEEGVNGYLVPPNDINDLAEKLEMLINDKVLRQSFGEAAYKKYKENYTLESFEHRLTSILKLI